MFCDRKRDSECVLRLIHFILVLLVVILQITALGASFVASCFPKHIIFKIIYQNRTVLKIIPGKDWPTAW